MAGVVRLRDFESVVWGGSPRGSIVYAVIEDGSHQYKVEEGDTFEVQRHDLEDGQDSLTFDQIVMVGGEGVDAPKIGQPYVAGAKVTAKVVAELKGDKITIVKYRRRKDSRTKMGHRQRYLRVTVDKIEA